MENLETEKASLYELWEQRKVTLDQSLELQLFYRDCQNADNQMVKQEVGDAGLLIARFHNKRGLYYFLAVIVHALCGTVVKYIDGLFVRLFCPMKMLETLLMQLMH